MSLGARAPDDGRRARLLDPSCGARWPGSDGSAWCCPRSMAARDSTTSIWWWWLEEMGRVAAAVAVHLDADVCRGDKPRRFRRSRSVASCPQIARGELVATTAHLEANGSWEADGITMAARQSGAGFVLDGDKAFSSTTRMSPIFSWSRRAPAASAARRRHAVRDRREAPGHHGDAAQNDGPDAQARRGDVPRRQGVGGRRRGRGQQGMASAGGRDRSRARWRSRPR